MITCCIRYQIAPGKLNEFEEYARRWTRLIGQLGGTHHGYFVPDEEPGVDTTFSFPGLGRQGASDVGMALYSFPDVAAYDRYRRLSVEDAEVREVTAFFAASKCFTSYERTFVRRVT